MWLDKKNWLGKSEWTEKTPLLEKEGWTRPQEDAAKPPLIGADGHERSECEPDRAKPGRKVARTQLRVRATTPPAPSKVASQHSFDGAGTPAFQGLFKEGTAERAFLVGSTKYARSQTVPTVR